MPGVSLVDMTLGSSSFSAFFSTVPVWVAAIAVMASGCASSSRGSVPPQGQLMDASAAEKGVFASVSSFYCAKQRWPARWSDVVKQQGEESDAVAFLERFGEPTLASPRAIVLTLTYTKEGGGSRTATFIAPPYCGERSDDKRRVSIAGGGVVFELPKGFTLMKGVEMQSRWKAPPYPDAVWSSADDVLIAIRFGDVQLDAEQTGQFFHDLSEAYQASVPSLVWRTRDVRIVGDTTVLRHEFENSSSRGQLVNVVLSASFDGYLFAITVTGPAQRAEAVVAAAAQLEGSLRVRLKKADS